ncbi:MAG: UDP-N-acetylmuramate dehydrogenase [Sphingobacteriaceae bacterium]
MAILQQHVSLKKHNTFGVEAEARWFAEVKNEADLSTLFNHPEIKGLPILVIGGGSNMLFTQNFEGLVVWINNKGISYDLDGDTVLLKSAAGEIWNDLVNYAVDHGFAGMENLSLIPGTVGASPVQNIGAYGVELDMIFESCRAFEIQTGKFRTFAKAECGFSYRESIFKQALKGKYIITEVTYRLKEHADINSSYGAIREELARRGITHPGIKEISQVVSAIRVSKLPDPSTIGNAGSFFKNPVISIDKFIQLQSSFPDIVHYPMPNNQIKLAAGWLIEQCGWKGKNHGHTGTWKNQALVLVNHGQATGKEVFDFSSLIIDSVFERFGVSLEREVNII